jgi:SAM-dependent methyltransferase
MKTVVTVYDFASRQSVVPRVLDLGAGEGSVTLPFLELGAKVTAVDISSSQLDELQNKCEHFGDRLEVRCEDIGDTLRVRRDQYDIIVVNSFLHHVPDYMGLLRQIIVRLTVSGQFFSFQDPLRYDSVGKFPTAFSNFAYFSWRIFKGDAVGGIKRRLRRSRGVYLPDSMYDNAEYHVNRNGVDQEAVCRFFKTQGFECDLLTYFSTQSRLFQPLGTVLGVKNTFSVVARRQTRTQAPICQAILGTPGAEVVRPS